MIFNPNVPNCYSYYQLLVKPIKVLKILNTFLSRPRPRLWVSRPRPRLYFLSSRRLETKTGLEDYITDFYHVLSLSLTIALADCLISVSSHTSTASTDCQLGAQLLLFGEAGLQAVSQSAVTRYTNSRQGDCARVPHAIIYLYVCIVDVNFYYTYIQVY